MKALTAEEIRALLKELAAFPGGPAEALRILGIKGVTGSALSCPIHRYLSAHGKIEAVYCSSVSAINTFGLVVCPPEVSKFIGELDSGLHKDLIE